MGRWRKVLLLYAINTLLWAAIAYHLYFGIEADAITRAAGAWLVLPFTGLFVTVTIMALLMEWIAPKEGMAFGCALPFTALSTLLLIFGLVAYLI